MIYSCLALKQWALFLPLKVQTNADSRQSIDIPFIVSLKQHSLP